MKTDLISLARTIRQAAKFKRLQVTDIGPAPLHADLVALHSPLGQRMQDTGLVNVRLLDTFVAQTHPAFCVLATTAMAMRYLDKNPGQADIGEREVMAPLRSQHPSGWFGSLGFGFLDSAPLPHQLKWRLSEHIVHAGLSTSSMEKLLVCHGLQPQRFTATDTDDHQGIQRFRAAVIAAAAQATSSCVLANYQRGAVHQIPVNNGHMSPIGGYHGETDRCLVLDTNSWRYPPVWVEVDLLWRAMCQRSNIGTPRGYVVVR